MGVDFTKIYKKGMGFVPDRSINARIDLVGPGWQE